MASRQQPHAIFDAWADYFDLASGDRAPMAEFYCGLVGHRTRSILELACGTGTITLALAQRLLQHGGTWEQSRIVGIDESAAMLRLARAKDARPEWLLGDMRLPPVQGTFDLVICCFNTVQSLLTDGDLAQFLRSVRSLLEPDGVFAFDIVQPDLSVLGGPQQQHLAGRVVDERGRSLNHLRKFSYNSRSRILTTDHWLVEAGTQAAGPLAQVAYRQYSAAEMERALVAAGFIVGQRYGGFDRSELVPASQKQIFVCSPCQPDSP